MSVVDLLQAAKAAAGVSSDYGLAKALGVSRFTVSGYVRGRTMPDPLVAFRLARLIGEDPARVVALLELERAQRKGEDILSAAWEAELGGLPSKKAPPAKAKPAAGPVSVTIEQNEHCPHLRPRQRAAALRALNRTLARASSPLLEAATA